MPADEVFHHLHLLLAIILLERSLPNDFDGHALPGEFALGLDGAGVDGLPEFMRGALGHDGNGEFLRLGQGGQGESEQNSEQAGQIHWRSEWGVSDGRAVAGNSDNRRGRGGVHGNWFGIAETGRRSEVGRVVYAIPASVISPLPGGGAARRCA